MSPVNVQFLGSGDAFGSGGRLKRCIYVDAGTARFFLDCGASALIAMKRWGVTPLLIDIILLTHLHGDHFGGLSFFLLGNEKGDEGEILTFFRYADMSAVCQGKPV